MPLRFGDEEHDKLVKALDEQQDFLLRLLSPLFQQGADNHKLYLSKIDDPRTATEKKWRANYAVPWPLVSVETQVATSVDIMSSVDQPIMPEAIGSEDEEVGGKLTRLGSYWLRKMKWRAKLDGAFRMSAIQGTEFRKSVWVNRVMPYLHLPDQKEKDRFDKSVLEASQRGAPPPPPMTDIEAFLLWVDMVNQAGTFGRIPTAPVESERELIHYRGPSWEHVPMSALRFDPLMDDTQDVPIWMQRIVKPNEWWKARAGGLEDDKPFDMDQVNHALGQSPGEDSRLSKWEREISSALGIEYDDTSDKLFENRSEGFEVWRKGEKYPYCVMLNRKAIINKTPEKWPFWHKQYPYHLLRNVVLPGHLPGIQELSLNKPLFQELNTLRNLRTDAVTLSIIPILLKLKEVGLPEMLRRLVPGMVLDVARLDGIKSLSDVIKVPEAIFRETVEIKSDVDESLGTQDIVRGASAPFSRTSATEISKRLDRALTRQRARVMRIEDELSTTIPQWFMLGYQFGGMEYTARAGGEDPKKDALQKYCVVPETRVLTEDLRWVPAGDVMPSDRLFGFDEEPGPRSKFRYSQATNTGLLAKECVAVITTNGRIVVSADHSFLGFRNCGADARSRRWIQAQDLKRGSGISFLAEPWGELASWDAGWMAGFLDGEGSLSTAKRIGVDKSCRSQVNWAQNEGLVLDRARAFLRQQGYKFSESVQKTGCRSGRLLGGLPETLRLLGSVRPVRFIGRSRELWDGHRSWTPATANAFVLAVEPVGRREVVALETSTKTFIAEGFFSHNSRNDFLEAIEMDFAFRGATNAINKELQTQQLSELYARAVSGPAPVVSPLEARTWLKRIYDNTGMRGSSEIFTDAGLAFVVKMMEAMMQPKQPPPA